MGKLVKSGTELVQAQHQLVVKFCCIVVYFVYFVNYLVHQLHLLREEKLSNTSSKLFSEGEEIMYRTKVYHIVKQDNIWLVHRIFIGAYVG